jgi:hypothetical protein
MFTGISRIFHAAHQIFSMPQLGSLFNQEALAQGQPRNIDSGFIADGAGG